MTSLVIKALASCRKASLLATGRTLITDKYLPQSIYHYSLLTINQVPKIMATKILPQIFTFVDKNVDSYKQLLKEAVAIPSVSCDIKYREDCIRMVYWMQSKLKEVGASTELRDVGFQTIDGQEVKLPPVLIGSLGNVSVIFHNKVLFDFKNN